MKIGFTGTRVGMSPLQTTMLTMIVVSLKSITEFHHGDCVGADEQALKCIQVLKIPGLRCICHPPVVDRYRARTTTNDEVRTRKSFLERNKDIVNECDILIAAPGGMVEVIRSGTWSTIRFARKQGKPVVPIFPVDVWDKLVVETPAHKVAPYV